MQLREIAGRGEIPDHFLNKIFQDLKKAGLVTSKRGPGGGYLLAVEPDQLTLAELFRVLDGLPTVPDIAGDDVEIDAAAKIGDQVCREVVDKFAEMLAEITVADLVQRGQKMGLARQGYEGFVYVI